MLLWLVKHSCPDINTAVRELSKVVDGATEAQWKDLMRTINFVLNSEGLALKIKPIKNGLMFYLEGIYDSNYADDKETRITVYGFIIYFYGVPIAWKSKSGRSVTLSSTEADYFASSDVAKEILFVRQILKCIGIDIKYPIKIRVDNVGAMFLCNTFSSSQRTKHIDIRKHFVRGYIEDDILKIVFVRSEDNDADKFTKNILKIVFVRSEDNDADMFTKNVTEEFFKKHSAELVEIPPKYGGC
jgi:hypothetical protein